MTTPDHRARTLDDGTDAGGNLVPPVHPECLAAIRAHLDAGYHQHSERAERMYNAGKPKNARVNRRMATALGWASGWIKDMAGGEG